MIKLKLKKKLWQNLKDQIVTKLRNSNCAKFIKLNCDNSKTQILIVIKMTVVTEVVIMTYFSKNTLTPWQLTNSQGSFMQLLQCFWNVLIITVFFFKNGFPIIFKKKKLFGLGGGQILTEKKFWKSQSHRNMP